LKAKIREIDGFELPFNGPTFNEFTIRRRVGGVEPVLAFLQERGILAGVDLGAFYTKRSDCFVTAVTEKISREDLNRFASALAEF
jgi:glycine dehydrogenase subunit 1